MSTQRQARPYQSTMLPLKRTTVPPVWERLDQSKQCSTAGKATAPAIRERDY